MITAGQARALYDASGTEVDEFIEAKCSKQVKDAANTGKRIYTVHLESVAAYTYPASTPLQKNVIAKLKSLGYTAVFGFYDEAYVPRGLADDAGEGPEHRNLGITISW